MPATLRPDPTFYPSPRLAMDAPDEELAYVALLRPDRKKPDAIAVVDTDPGSPSYGRTLHRLELTHKGDELHHFGWNARTWCER
jgi:selenium-binding protein 1